MTDQEKKELIDYRLSKASDTLDEIPVLASNRLYNTAINRMYYSCFYAVTALLLNSGIDTKTHSGVKQQFGLHFIVSGKLAKELGIAYNNLFQMRQKGDYEDFIVYSEEDINEFLPLARQLVQGIQKLLS